jgi:hypothetical protein
MSKKLCAAHPNGSIYLVNKGTSSQAKAARLLAEL